MVYDVTFIFFNLVKRWMSPKIEGLRVFWDGKNLYTKKWDKISISQNISTQIPNIPLDGILK